MKKTTKIISIGLILFVMLFTYGCGKPQPIQTTLSVQETDWSELGATKYDPKVFTPLQRGDLVYDFHDTKITVKSVTDDNIVLKIDGYMVEKNPDGTVNLNADPLKKIELTKAQSVKLASMTMSSGFNLEISYE